jgi:EmrB/QacA subfamily drug resistance transporter
MEVDVDVKSDSTPARQTVQDPAARELAPLLTVSIVSSLMMLDSNVVAVALPTIERSLGASFADLQWMISAYVLTFAALLLAAGDFADWRGRRYAMLIGLAIFGAASAGCGIAGSAGVLDAFRALQGLGGALLMTSSLAIISHRYSGQARTRAFAFWGASIGTALAVGPIIGGVVTYLVGWRPIFLVNAPICLLLALATLRYIDESCNLDAKGLDAPGIATFSTGLLILVWALIDGNDAGWTSPATLVRLAGAGILLGLFSIIETRRTRAMLDFTLFRKREFLGAILVMAAYGASVQVLIFLLPLYLQSSYGFQPVMAGLAMGPFALPMVLAPRLTSALATRFAPRVLLALGLLVASCAEIVFWIAARSELAYPVFAVGMLIAGAGAGLLNGLTVRAVQNAVPEARAGMASGIAATVRFVGLLVSVAGFGAVLSYRAMNLFVPIATAAGLPPPMAENIGRRLASGDVPRAIADVPAQLHQQLLTEGLDAYRTGFAAVSLSAAAVAVIAALGALWFLREASQAEPALPCQTVDCRHPV